MAAGAPKKKVFVSYAHESDEHKAQVLAFATFLRETGIDTVLDLWAADVRRDWGSWAIQEMTSADFVLVVASDRYRRSGDGHGPNAEHRGLQSESAVLRDLVHGDRTAWLPKILPVILPGHEIDEIPLFLQPHTASRYHVTEFTASGAEDLLRVILRQPGHIAPEIGPEPVLPPRSGQPEETRPDQAASPTEHPQVGNQVIGTINGKVIQVDTIEGDVIL